jgi:Ca2+-binding EF-hand superfamily protein
LIERAAERYHCSCKKVNFDDFVCYLNTLINGNQEQKARMSFSFLDTDKHGVLLYSDFEELVSNVAIFWGYLTGSRVVPDKMYVDKIV